MNANVLQCPLCSSPFQVMPEWAGRVVACPSCSGQVQIPESVQQAPAPEAQNEILRCPSCSGQFGVTPEMKGTQVGCPHCSLTVQIPGENEGLPDVGSQPQADAVPVIQRRKKRSPRIEIPGASGTSAPASEPASKTPASILPPTSPTSACSPPASPKQSRETKKPKRKKPAKAPAKKSPTPSEQVSSSETSAPDTSAQKRKKPSNRQAAVPQRPAATSKRSPKQPARTRGTGNPSEEKTTSATNNDVSHAESKQGTAPGSTGKNGVNKNSARNKTPRRESAEKKTGAPRNDDRKAGKSAPSTATDASATPSPESETTAAPQTLPPAIAQFSDAASDDRQASTSARELPSLPQVSQVVEPDDNADQPQPPLNEETVESDIDGRRNADKDSAGEFTPGDIGAIAPPTFDVVDPERLDLAQKRSGDNEVFIPDAEGGIQRVSKRIISVEHEGEKVQLISLSEKQKARRRMIQNAIVIAVCIGILLLAFALLQKSV